MPLTYHDRDTERTPTSNGPTVHVKFSCEGCVHRKEEPNSTWSFNDTSSFKILCTAQATPRRLHTRHVPEWCPCLDSIKTNLQQLAATCQVTVLENNE